MVRCTCIALLIFFTGNLQAQETVTIKVVDSLTKAVLPVVTVSLKGKNIAVTDTAGLVTIRLANAGEQISFSSVGYQTKMIMIPAAGSALVTVSLVPEQQSLDDITVISSTRNGQRIENSPLKVEVLGREEMDEENTIKPASIASILGDISGVQVQQSGSISGNVNVRILGLEGRYTQILRDGMPLFDGFSGGFGILSIAPLDLKQVEIIKGSAATLYGGGAIGGLINLISRRPTTQQEITFTLNQSSLQESNTNIYIAKRNKHTGYNFFGGYTRQKAVDVNKDGFSDVGKLKALVLHPRLFFYPGDHTTILTGYTAVVEDRQGGDMTVLKDKPDDIHRYIEKNKTRRHSGELLIEQRMKGNIKIELKAGVSSFTRGITSNTHYFNGRQFNYFTELSLLVPYGKHSFVAGINFSGDHFKKLPGDPILLDNFSNQVTGAFVQNTWQLSGNTIFEAGLRSDHHDEYGYFFLPRIAVFHRLNAHWATRLGIGMGYKTPNPLSAQLIDYAIGDIQPIAASVKAERSVGYNAEINYKNRWENGNSIFINHAFFLTAISDPVITTNLLNGTIFFSNASGQVVTKGFDTYVQAHVKGWELYTGYTFTIAERKYSPAARFVPLTPKNRMAFTIVKEWEESWRIGLEGSYNGLQHREDGTKTPGYFFMAGLIEKKFGTHISIILNGENLLDFRQSKHEPLFSGSVTHPVFVPLWAPVDGRVVNLAIRVKR